MRDSVQQAATNIESSVQSELNKAETELNKAAESAVGEPNAPAQLSPASTPSTDAQVSPAPEPSASAQVSPAHEAAPAIMEKAK